MIPDLLVLGITIVSALFVFLVSEILIGWFARRSADEYINQLLDQEEQITFDDPYIQCRPSMERLNARGRPRIAMVAPGGAPDKFTSRQRIIPMAITLEERGYAVKVFIPCWDCPEEPYHQQWAGSLSAINIGPGIIGFRHFDPFLFLRLLRKVIEFEPDVIYCFKPIRYGGAIAVITTLMRKFSVKGSSLSKMRIAVDSDDWEGLDGWAERTRHSRPVQFTRDLQERFTIKNCDVVITSTSFLQERASHLRKDSQSVHVIYNGIRRELWSQRRLQSERPEWLSAQLADLGNPSLLLLYTRYVEIIARDVINIFASILSNIPNAALLIVGQSLDDQSRHQRLELFSLAQKAGIDLDRIIVAGWLPYRELLSNWSAVNVAICPFVDNNIVRSRFPMKILELMAAGKAIVASSVGEIPKLIEHRKSGILVPYGDLEAFSEEVITLLGNEGTQRRLGEAARTRALTAFDWQILINRLEMALGLGNSGGPSVMNEANNGVENHKESLKV